MSRQKKVTEPLSVTVEEQVMQSPAVEDTVVVPPPMIQLKPRHLRVLLSNQIDDFSWTTLFAVVEERLKRLKTLYLYVDSPGGDVTAMKSIISYIEALKSYGVKIVTISMRSCMSAALPIFVCGDERYALGTSFMEHLPYYPRLSDSTHEDLNYDSKRIEMDLNTMLKYATRGTKLTPGQFLAMINAAHKKTLEFGPEEAYDWGILTHDCPPPRIGGPIAIIKQDEDRDTSDAKKK
jgi:ATP-dependent protease ClpP protease subunit